MNITEKELNCYARMLKSAMETGGWVINECQNCPYKNTCEDKTTNGYSNEYLLSEKLYSITGVNIVDCIPYASETVS